MPTPLQAIVAVTPVSPIGLIPRHPPRVACRRPVVRALRVGHKILTRHVLLKVRAGLEAMAIGLTSGLTAVICEPTFGDPEAEPLTLLRYRPILVKDIRRPVRVETALLGARGTKPLGLKSKKSKWFSVVPRGLAGIHFHEGSKLPVLHQTRRGLTARVFGQTSILTWPDNSGYN